MSSDASVDQHDEEPLYEELLFSSDELPDLVTPEPKVARLEHPVWTENKAKLIERYLLYFEYITKHGTYIDGFAGPQESDKPEMWPEMWAAKLVLENEPRWFRHFYLFEKDRRQVQRLEELRATQPLFFMDKRGRSWNREIEIFAGDFNELLPGLLSSGRIRQKEATFCLLDQRTFECQWASVQQLAAYKQPGNNKIEVFYFLAIGWLQRALSALQDKGKLERWWGRGDYEAFRTMTTEQRVNSFVARFKQELGYKSVKPWPIFEKQHSSNIMYYMIHATDHPAAPGLMSRAYSRAVRQEVSDDQLLLWLELASESDREPEE